MGLHHYTPVAPLLYTGASTHPGGTPTQGWTTWVPAQEALQDQVDKMSRFNALLKIQPVHKNDYFSVGPLHSDAELILVSKIKILSGMSE